MSEFGNATVSDNVIEDGLVLSDSDWIIDNTHHDHIEHEETIEGDQIILDMNMDIKVGQDVIIGDDHLLLEDHMDLLIDESEELEHHSDDTHILPKDPRTDEIIYTKNLPDLLSKTISFEGGESITICFSKRCRSQLAMGGLLYNVIGERRDELNCRWKCANENCKALIRTSPDYAELLFTVPDHSPVCVPDDLQVRLRIAVFDLRLMAEFTDVPFDDLYKAFGIKLNEESQDVFNIFPSFETIKRTLIEHRLEKTYRKRFEVQAVLRAKKRAQERIVALQNEHNNSVNQPPLRYRRTKPLPAIACLECNAEICSAPDLSSQDLLIEHLQIYHQKHDIHFGSFQFSDLQQFEQWLRAAMHGSGRLLCKLKRYGVFEEQMYYLCGLDYRLNGRRPPLIDGLYCPAFVRVRDFRQLQNRMIEHVTVDYCLNHCFHAGDEPFDPALLPETFCRELELKRKRTQEMMLVDPKLQRVRRVAQMGVGLHTPSRDLRVFPSFSSSPSPYEFPSPRMRPHNLKPPILIGDDGVQNDNQENHQLCELEAGCEESQTFDENGENTVRADMTSSSNATEVVVKSVDSNQMKMDTLITKRENFKDFALYNHVLQFEKQCEQLKVQMQFCRTVSTAKKYLYRMCKLLTEVTADPGVCHSWEKEEKERELNLKKINEATTAKTNTPYSNGGTPGRRTRANPMDDEVPAKRATTSTSQNSEKTIEDCIGQSTSLSQSKISNSAKNEQMQSKLNIVLKPGESLAKPPQQRVFVKRDSNGKMVFVKRTIITKVRTVPQKEGGDESGQDIVHPSSNEDESQSQQSGQGESSNNLRT